MKLKLYFSKIICNLLNLCFGESKYPDQLKIARVVPVQKRGCRQTLDNYRPISILNNLNKFFKSVIYSRIYSFFEKYKLYNVNQYGFRWGLSMSCLHTPSFTYSIMPAFIDQQFAAVFFLDFSKAFDTVQRNILLAKFNKFGVRELSLQLIASYL